MPLSGAACILDTLRPHLIPAFPRLNKILDASHEELRMPDSQPHRLSHHSSTPNHANVAKDLQHQITASAFFDGLPVGTPLHLLLSTVSCHRSRRRHFNCHCTAHYPLIVARALFAFLATPTFLSNPNASAPPKQLSPSPLLGSCTFIGPFLSVCLSFFFPS